MGTINQLGTKLPIHDTVSGIDRQNLRLEMLIGKSQVIAQQLPHRLAGQGKLLQFLLRVILSGDQPVNLARCEISNRSGLIDLEVLENVPS
ncbi:MAG: hypothetical protein EAZ84_09160 [Verrucomicrobia bacterium]|nr:MAG: hypothetical protein EAZ84_09160 [Verrucomicrobiota bacterium]TAE85845.1 MAG: hypothetical protein EAZ82_12805 [Verrucomicrobiota bacterium]TAF23372.1 MAG: hypothetical protein EAZ71_12910 [Verrucomicrobiota bacterium]